MVLFSIVWSAVTESSLTGRIQEAYVAPHHRTRWPPARWRKSASTFAAGALQRSSPPASRLALQSACLPAAWRSQEHRAQPPRRAASPGHRRFLKRKGGLHTRLLNLRTSSTSTGEN